MDSTDVCPNCGKYILCEDHRCLPDEEDVIGQMEDSDDSTPFLDEIVKVSESFDELAATSAKEDFSEELENNSLERTEGECPLLRLSSSKKTPLISGGNPPSPPEKENFAEENQKDESEDILALRQNFENDPEFFIDRSQHSDQQLQGNPLGGLPFQLLSSDESRDSTQNEDENLKSANSCEKKESKNDAATVKAGPELKFKYRSISETSPLDLSGDSHICPSRPGPSRHSRTESKNSPLKHSSEGSSSGRQCGKSSAKECHVHRNTLETPPVNLPCGSQDDPSRPGPSGYTTTESKKSPIKRSPNWSFRCDICGKQLASLQTLRVHKLLHSNVRPHVCELCGKGFVVKSYLINHASTHTREWHYKCKECGKMFTQSTYLNNLYRAHTGNMPYKCYGCGETFVCKKLSCKHCRRPTT